MSLPGGLAAQQGQPRWPEVQEDGLETKARLDHAAAAALIRQTFQKGNVPPMARMNPPNPRMDSYVDSRRPQKRPIQCCASEAHPDTPFSSLSSALLPG